MLLNLADAAGINSIEKEKLLKGAQTQQQQLIEKYGMLKQDQWQLKCDELIAELGLNQFKQCLLINAKFANAYSLAHGNVILTKGLLENIYNDDQLAHILAHEHAHLLLNHHQQAQELVKKPPKFFTKSRIKKFYRKIEKQADQNADHLLKQFNKDYLQIQHYLKRVQGSYIEQSKDHEKLKTRIKKVRLPNEKSETFWFDKGAL